jgi:hypothetical protein
MSCTLINAGIAKDCSNNIGGISKIYITDFESVDTLTVGTGETITTITMVGGRTFYEYQFNRNTATFTENAVVNVENGSLFYDQTVTLRIPKREQTKRDKLALLTQKDLAVIVLDQNGKYWYPGELNGVYLSEMPSESGTAKGDFNGYTITLKGEELEGAREVEASAVTAVI